MRRLSRAAREVADRAARIGIDPEPLLDFEAARRRPLKRRMAMFFRTRKPILDDAPYRAFDSTADYLFVEKTTENGERLTRALRELGFAIGAAEEADIRQGKVFIQLRNGPFDVDLVYAPDGIEGYEDARRRGGEIDGFRVCSMQDVIESKVRSNRDKDRESLPRLRDFARYLEREPRSDLRPLRRTPRSAS